MPTIEAENRDVVGEAYNLNPSQYGGINYDLIVPVGVTVQSRASNAIDSYEPEGAHTITVHGTVIADDDGVKLLGVQGTSHINISATGVVTAGPSTADPPNLLSNAVIIDGLNSTVDNAGTLWGSNAGIYISAPMVNYVTGTTSITNSGSITGLAYGLEVSVGFGTIAVDNSGTITGPIAIGGGGGIEVITNSGTINGSVNLSYGDDSFTNSGTLNGAVDLGEGDDIFSDTSTTAINHDSVNGGLGDDTLLGGAGNDTLIGGGGNDSLDGGEGFDTAMFSGNDALTLSLANTGAQAVAGGFVTLTDIEALVAGAGNDSLTGNALANLLDGGLGDDGLAGGAGDDTLIGGGGNDSLDGGEGFDTAMFSGNDALTLSLANTGAQAVAGGFVTLTDIEALVAGAGNDSLTGNALANLLDGGAGDDTLSGGAGNDTLIGGSGFDTFVFSGSDPMVLSLAVTTAQTLTGGFVTLSGIEALIAGDGDDSLTGNAEANLLGGGLGDDTLAGDAGDDTLSGGDGNDSLLGGAGNDSLTGGIGADRALGGLGDDTLSGQADNDDLRGDGGNDSLLGGAGDDTLGGGANNDILLGGAGNDVLTGSYGLDRLEGAIGSDLLDGSSGADTLSGGTGADTLIGGGGADDLAGNSGADTFRFLARSHGGDTITGFTAQDRLEFEGAAFGYGSATGKIAAADCATNTAKDASDHWVYDKTARTLYFDADGNGSGAGVAIATFEGGTFSWNLYLI